MQDRERLTLALDSPGFVPALLELSAALVRNRSVEVHAVFIESSAVLRAAALPFAQVLAAGAWEPLDAGHVERLLRAHAERVRRQLGEFAARLDLVWSFDVVRGAMPSAALDAVGERSALTLLGAGPPAPGLRTVGTRTVAVLDTHDEAGARAIEVARGLAEAIGARLLRLDANAWPRSPLAGGLRALVVPRAAYVRLEGVQPGCPVLLVE